MITADPQQRAQEVASRFERYRPLLAEQLDGLENRTVLDVGCGHLASDCILLSACGARSIGVDSWFIEAGGSTIRNWPRALHEGGVLWLGRSVLSWGLRWDRRYYDRLSRLSGLELGSGSLDLRRGDARSLPLERDSCDAAISLATLEHIEDVETALDEMWRVLRPGGIAVIQPHLFPSLTGGHQFPEDIGRSVPPWDHLRARTAHYPFFLNQRREIDYVMPFAERFELLKTLDEWELDGPRWLRQVDRAELEPYGDEELLKKSITLVGRKRMSAGHGH